MTKRGVTHDADPNANVYLTLSLSLILSLWLILSFREEADVDDSVNRSDAGHSAPEARAQVSSDENEEGYIRLDS